MAGRHLGLATPDYFRPSPKMAAAKSIKLPICTSPPQVIDIKIVGNEICTAALLHKAVTDDDNAFFVMDLSRVVHLNKRWKQLMPRVEPFYAVKCNNDPVLLSLLNRLGTGFDCASAQEIKSVISMGTAIDMIIYANPVKPIQHLKCATKAGVHMSTFDCEDELIKVANLDPKAELIVRIRADDERAAFSLGAKFGASVSEACRLLDMACKMNVSVIGVSFHIGWNCGNPSAYGQAIEMAHQVFQYASTIGYNFTLLDIGGGFPGHHGSEEVFEAISTVVNTSLLKFFDDERIRVVAEPGTYFAMSPFTLATCVVGRRQVEDSLKEKAWMYYVGDGTYGSLRFREDYYKDFCPPHVLEAGVSQNRNVTNAKIWGPTCCSSDEVMSECQLPELNIGEWLYFENMGAYSSTVACTFNGYPVAKPLYYLKQRDSQEIQEK